ncbi:hypothetical protein M1545_03095 [Patescibacteria group bacterium]|nr:hypothetical protein [Patescibacteria group bacterium]
MSIENKEAERERILGVDREVPCKVLPGMFPHEIGVLIELPGGQVISGFFDELYASWEGELKKGEGIDGRFGVYTIEEDENTVLIQFTTNPGQHLMPNSPSRARVPKDFLLPKEQVAA